ncbi:MAG: hypothetical protein WB616_22930 [Candidatus Sulfotelmatobacter sp.]
MAREDFRGDITLQRCETEGGTAIAVKNELDEAVAEPADAVVKQGGVWHG